MVDTNSAHGVGMALPCDGRQGSRHLALDLVIAQDDSSPSGGGHGPRESLLREAIRFTVQLLDARARVALVGFGGELPLARIDSGGRRRVVARAEAAPRMRGIAHYPSTLRSALDALGRGDPAYGWPPYRVAGRRAAVILLGDGQDRIDPYRVPDEQQREELLSEGGTCRILAARGCPVYAIHFGGTSRASGGPNLLLDVASATGGTSFTTATTEELLRACKTIVHELSGLRVHGEEAWGRDD